MSGLHSCQTMCILPRSRLKGIGCIGVRPCHPWASNATFGLLASVAPSMAGSAQSVGIYLGAPTSFHRTLGRASMSFPAHRHIARQLPCLWVVFRAHGWLQSKHDHVFIVCQLPRFQYWVVCQIKLEGRHLPASAVHRSHQDDEPILFLTTAGGRGKW